MQKIESNERVGRGRGRPRAFDRDQALAAAMKLFWHKGFSATSIADLTATMGIGAPSLYAAFGSKEGLYREAVRFYGDSRGRRLWARFESAPTAREAVEALLLDSAATLAAGCGEDPPGCMVTLSAVGSEGAAELGRLVAEARADALARVTSRFDRAVADGELPNETDVPALARLVLAMQAGLSIQARDGATREELQRTVRAAMSGWIHMMGPITSPA